MASPILSQSQFQNEDKAREYLESLVWSNGIVCPHCGVVGKHYELKGKSHRKGLFKCVDCREQFTVTVGTVFERSKIKLHIWLQAVHLVSAAKNGISSMELHRLLGVTQKTAWFMIHRIREAMKPDSNIPLGGVGAIVEADETYFTHSKRSQMGKIINGRLSLYQKERVLSLVERGGNVRSFRVPMVTARTISPILIENIASESTLMTDDAKLYKTVGKEFSSHESVNHSAHEYARGIYHTNTIESFFSRLKRSILGTYHHVSGQHLKRYIAEFDFRYNTRKSTDSERACLVLAGITGKRMTYR